MDIAVKKSSTIKNKKHYVIAAIVAIPLLFAINYLWSIGQAGFSVKKETVVFSEVKRGKFTVSVRGTGLLVPNNIQWLSTDVDATVKRVVLKAGNVVKAGDLIVELSNPQLEQELVEAKWEVEAIDSELKADKAAQISILQQQKSNELNAKLDYEKSLNEYNAYTKIIATGAVSRVMYDKVRVEMDQAKQRWLSSEEQLAKLKENLVAQNRARVARLNITTKRAERIQQQVDNLQVKATIDSIVLEMPLEAGQRLMTGTKVAKLAQQDLLIAELKVPEIQIRDVALKQRVIIDTRNSKIEGFVSRIDPAVVNGTVQVDVAFTEKLPDDARPDLSVDGEIKITELADVLYVARPLFAQSKASSAFYKLTPDSKYAERVDVKLGFGSVNQIQVVEGLQVGDQVLTSDPSRFESHKKFRIN